MKRFIALLLAVLTVGCAFASCAQPKDEDDNDDKSGKDRVTTTVATDNPVSEQKYVSDNPKLDYEGATVTTLSRSNEWVKDEIWAEAPNGETINDAVFTRNSQVEKELNVEIKSFLEDGDNYAVSKKIVALQASNELEFDFFANSVYSTIMDTEKGNFANLYKCEYMEFDKPWYSQNFIDVASAGEELYLVTGSLALSMYRFIFATFFNESLISNVLTDGTDLYDIVNMGKWTLSYQMNLAEQIYSDTDGDQAKSANDLYGFITNGDEIGVDPYWSSCELRILDKNDENWYEYVLDAERLSNAVDRILDLIWNCKGSYSYQHTSGDGEQAQIRAKFASKGAAMATLRIIESESQELRDNKDYGILPMPKLKTSQANYYSYAHDQMTAFGIFSWLPEQQLQRAGALLNAMNYYSIITVQPDYYEIALKSKYLNNEKSWDMLDMIVRNLYIDGGVLYTKQLDSVHQQLRTIIARKSNVVSSIYGSNKDKYKALLVTLTDGIKEVQGK